MALRDLSKVVRFENAAPEDEVMFWDAVNKPSGSERIMLWKFRPGFTGMLMVGTVVGLGTAVDTALPGNPPLLKVNTCSRQISLGRYRWPPSCMEG
jgi:hypothetical protein